MKKLIKLFNVILPLLLLLQLNIFAQDDSGKEPKFKYEFEKTKSVNRSYNVSTSDKLSIENKFGTVEIHTWNKNEIKVDIEIKVSAKTEEWAKSVLNDIQVEDSKAGNGIMFKTLFVEDLDKKEGKPDGEKRMDKYKNKNTHQILEVNYNVYMPVSNPLKILNQFGPTTIPEYKGEIDLVSKFGSLTTGLLTNIKNIKVEFGKASFESISNCSVTVEYSKAEFKKLIGNIKLDLKFCEGTKVNVDNNLSNLDIKASYSTVNLKPAADFSASYGLATNFSDFHNRTNIKFDSDDSDNGESPRFERKYNGKSGSGTIPVKVSANFGKIILGEPDTGDMEDKDKSKSKRKSRTS